jgi:imidazolonepropionase-like amidohydrolase
MEQGTMNSTTEPSRIWITNALIFDGENEELRKGNILIVNEMIEQVLYNEVESVDFSSDQCIDAKGHVVTPGFIDVHCHIMLSDPFHVITNDTAYVQGIKAAKIMEGMLQRGFTTIRDAGGADSSLRLAVDKGLIAGPRLYPCGKFISQTGGHGDFISGGVSEDYITLCRCNLLRNCYGMSYVADGPDQVLHSARENLKSGSTQIKICASGGVASQYDPIWCVQYTPAEIQAVVSAANNWGTYVMAHAYNDPSVRMCVENGVKSIEHGSLISEETAKMCAEKDIILSTQYVCYWVIKNSGGSALSPASLAKLESIEAEMKKIGGYIRKFGILTGFGTDIVGSGHEYQNVEFTLRQKDGFSNLQILRQATVEGGKIVGLCGKLNPYGPVGVIRPGAMADLLVHDMNPLNDISVMENYESQLLLIMRDGCVFKNILDGTNEKDQ